MSGMTRVHPADLSQLHVPSLTALSLAASQLPLAATLDVLGRHQSLRELRLRDCGLKLSADSMQALPAGLQVLELSGNRLSDSTVSSDCCCYCCC